MHGVSRAGAWCSFLSSGVWPYDNLLIHMLDLCVFALFFKKKKKGKPLLLEEREKVLIRGVGANVKREREESHQSG